MTEEKSTKIEENGSVKESVDQNQDQGKTRDTRSSGKKKFPRKRRDDRKEDNMQRVVLSVRRVSRTMKGGRRLSFSSFAVVGDKKGNVGMALGKSNDVRNAVRKSIKRGETRMRKVKIWNETIPHSVEAKYCSARVILRPAPPGTGIIAARSIRAVLDVAGIQNIKAKVLGSSDPISVARATFKALQSLRTKEELYEILKS